MNNDLISREALKVAIDKEFEKANLSEYEACVCVCEIYDKCINNAPTIDIQTAVMELYKRYQPRLATNVYEFGVELQELLGRYGKEVENENR